MDGTRPHHSLSDLQLDRELDSALGIEPSPEFLARVRTRVGAEPAATMWRQALRGRGFQPVVAGALVAVLLTVVIPALMREDAGRSKSAVPATPALQIRAERGREVESPTATRPAVVPARAREIRSNDVPLQLSQPLFSVDERRALAELVTAVEEGRVPPMVTESATAATAQPDAQTALRIEPLVIDPLPLLAARAQTEGERKW